MQGTRWVAPQEGIALSELFRAAAQSALALTGAPIDDYDKIQIAGATRIIFFSFYV